MTIISVSISYILFFINLGIYTVALFLLLEGFATSYTYAYEEDED